MNDNPKDADIKNDADDDNDENLTIDTSVSLEEITVIDLEQILENLEKDNPEPDRAAQKSRKRLESLLEEKRAKEAMKDLDDYDLDG